MKKNNMSFDDEEIAPVEIIQEPSSQTKKTSVPVVPNKPESLVSANDSMFDIHQKLKKASKNEQDAIYASAREQDLLKRMDPADELRRKHENSCPTIRAGQDRVNLLARKVRAINSDGDTIEIDMVAIKETNRKKYLQDIGKLPSEENESIQKKKKLKDSLSFDD
jgi:hypothetical protein